MVALCPERVRFAVALPSLRLQLAGRDAAGSSDRCFWPGCRAVGTSDHIAGSGPRRPAHVPVAPHRSEFLRAHFGWALTGCDMLR